MAKTIEQLKAQSAEVKNATVVGENTATRVGTLFTDIVEYIEQVPADGAVTTEKLAPLAITTAKIAKGAVTGDKIAAGTITEDNIADKSLSQNVLANDAVSTRIIQDGAVTTEKLADSAMSQAMNNAINRLDSTIGEKTYHMSELTIVGALAKSNGLVDVGATTLKTTDYISLDGFDSIEYKVFPESEGGYAGLFIYDKNKTAIFPFYAGIGEIGSFGEAKYVRCTMYDDSCYIKLIASQSLKNDIMNIEERLDNINGYGEFSSYIHIEDNQYLRYRPLKWIYDYNECSIEMKLKLPDVNPNATKFLLSWLMGDKNWYLFFDRTGALYLRIGENETGILGQPDWGNIIILKISKKGNNYSIFSNGSQVAALVAPDFEKTSDVYICRFPTAPGNTPIIDFYYLKLSSLNDTIEEIMPNSGFVENTGEIIFSTAEKKFNDVFQRNTIFKGAFNLNSTISINGNIRGNGCTIICGENAHINVGNGGSIEGFTFLGSYNPIRTKTIKPYALDPLITEDDIANVESYTNNSLILLNGTNANVINCTFKHLGQTAIVTDNNTSAYTSSKQSSISDCEFDGCKCGISNRSEFITIHGNRFVNCIYGLYAFAGNMGLCNNKFFRCDVALCTGNSGNECHSEICGNEFAHNGLFSIYVPICDILTGLVISGCQFFDGDLLFKNASGININGCRINALLNFIQDKAGNYGVKNIVSSCYFGNSYVYTEEKKAVMIGEGCNVNLKNNIAYNSYADIISWGDADVNN